MIDEQAIRERAAKATPGPWTRALADLICEVFYADVPPPHPDHEAQVAALAESGYGIARQEVIEDTRRLVRYFTGGPTGWDEANVLARRIRAALEADR